MAWIPEGVKDLLGSECERKERLKQKMKELFKSYGYRQIETPTFEYYDTFSEIKNTVDKEKTLKMIDQDGKILVLRPDVTTPVVRMAASRSASDADYQKYCYCMNVFRINTEEHEREMTQAGIELLGEPSAYRDGEVISLAIESLLISGAKQFQIDIGQTEYIRGLLTGVDHQQEIKRHIANKNFLCLETALNRLELPSEQRQAILQVPYLYGNLEDVLKNVHVVNSQAEKAVRNLTEIHDLLTIQGYGKYVSFDLGMVQGINYYAGMIFKGYMENYGRPVLSGGRYDGMMRKDNFCGAGFGVDIDGLIQALNANEIGAEFQVKTDYLVCGKDVKAVLLKCREFRHQGYIAEAYFGHEAERVAAARNVAEIIRV